VALIRRGSLQNREVQRVIKKNQAQENIFIIILCLSEAKGMDIKRNGYKNES